MSYMICRGSSTCENDVGDVAMATVAKLLRILKVAMASQTHHERLGVVEGGGLVIQAVRVDGRLHHVELLQLEHNRKKYHNNIRHAPKQEYTWTLVSKMKKKKTYFINPQRYSYLPVATEHWPEWTGAAGRKSLQTRCPGWSYAATTNKPNV